MVSSHHAHTERAHNQTRCRRHDQRRDSDSGEPIPMEREAGSGDSQPGDRKDTAISDPGSQTAYPIMCTGAGRRLRDLNALHPLTPSARHVEWPTTSPDPCVIEKVSSSSQYAVHRSAPPLLADRPCIVLSISDAISGLSHSAAPILRATSRPSRSISKVVGSPGSPRPRDPRPEGST